LDPHELKQAYNQAGTPSTQRDAHQRNAPKNPNKQETLARVHVRKFRNYNYLKQRMAGYHQALADARQKASAAMHMCAYSPPHFTPL
jgi:hypothetical protein